MSSDLISSNIAGKEKYDLILVEDTTDEMKYCSLCSGYMSVPYYKSKEAGEVLGNLHKVCGDLHLEMEHQQHSGHTLRLCTSDDDGSCSVCQYMVPEDKGYYYGCSECKEEFVLCIACALKLFPFTHQYHPQHPLIPIHDVDEDFNCRLCTTFFPAPSYKCTTCSFQVHEHCVSSSRIINLPFHGDHDLRLIYSLPESGGSGEPICCQICQGDMKGESCAYHCAECNSFFHVHNCRHMLHFSHDHPLAFVEGEEEVASTDSESRNCYACRVKISVPYYYCIDRSCEEFILHKSCAEVPQNAQHHLHPGHTLELSKVVYDSICNACDLPWQGFSYSCCADDPSCPFTIDIICASKALLHKLKFHKHPLIPSPMKGPFACHACDRDSDDTTFKCTTCRFWVHQHCASLPKLKTSDWHPHKLKLIYSLPDSLRENLEYFRCSACKEEIQPHYWAYHCAGCRHFTHVYNCSKTWEPDPDAVLANAVHLPVATKSLSLATLFFMDTDQEEANVLESKPQEDTNGAKARPMMFLDPKETCGKCEQFLAAPCNNCDLCKYFLPMPPQELMKWDATREGYLSKVKPTEEHNCRGFTVDCRWSGPIIKISSSVLPRYVKHEGHDHVLSTIYLTTKTWCNACEIDFTGYGFRCSFCGFTIDTYCALLPRSITHRYDKEHPFKLTYFSIEGVKEYVCEICEEDITTMWFYHCVECDHSIHARCIWDIHIMFGPFIIDPYGLKLTLVPATSTLYKCRVCDGTKTSECHYTLLYKKYDNETLHLECIPKVEGEWTKPRIRKSLCGMEHNI